MTQGFHHDPRSRRISGPLVAAFALSCAVLLGAADAGGPSADDDDPWFGSGKCPTQSVSRPSSRPRKDLFIEHDPAKCITHWTQLCAPFGASLLLHEGGVSLLSETTIKLPLKRLDSKHAKLNGGIVEFRDDQLIYEGPELPYSWFDEKLPAVRHVFVRASTYQQSVKALVPCGFCPKGLVVIQRPPDPASCINLPGQSSGGAR